MAAAGDGGTDAGTPREDAFLSSLDPSAGPQRLEGADLHGMRLGAEALRGRGDAPWRGSEGGLALEGALLDEANLLDADLSGSDLSRASARKVVARSADFTGSRVEASHWAGSDLSGARFGSVAGGQADFTEAMLEDAEFGGAGLRFARFDRALLDGSRFEGADLWGARFAGADADDAVFRGARLDEADLSDANLTGADLRDASLRKANLSGSRLQGALLAGANLAGADLSGANLSGTTLDRLDLSSCLLRNARFAGAWVTGTRITRRQVGMVGEEAAGEFEAAIASYLALEQNFRSIGRGGDAAWAYKRGRHMGRCEAGRLARQAVHARDPGGVVAHGYRWVADRFVEWLCDYGESLSRIVRAFVLAMVLFTALFGIAGGMIRDGEHEGTRNPIDLASYSILNILTSNPPDIGLKPTGRFTNLLVGLEGATGIILMGLFGFVLGNRIRN